MKHFLLHYAQSVTESIKQYVIRKVVISRTTCWRYGFVSLPGNDYEDADIPRLIETTQPLAHLCCLVPALEVPKPTFTYPGPTVEARRFGR
jgi:hypothetical protein